MLGEACLDVGRVAGVERAVAAFEDVEVVALGIACLRARGGRGLGGVGGGDVCGRAVGLGLVLGAGARALGLKHATSGQRNLFSQFACEFGEKFRQCGVDRLLLQLAFPYHVNAPAVGFECGDVLPVALDVSLELRGPVLHVLLRGRKFAVRASVPEASVHEHADFLAWPGDIGVPCDLPLQTVSAKSRRAQPLAHQKLGLGVGALVSLHRLVHREVRGSGGVDSYGAIGNCPALAGADGCASLCAAAVRLLGGAFVCRRFPLPVYFRQLVGNRAEFVAPALDEALGFPGGVRGACRGEYVRDKPDLPLQVALVEAARRGAVADDGLDMRALGDALDVRGHDVFDACVRGPLDVAFLDGIPQRDAALEEKRLLRGNRLLKRCCAAVRGQGLAFVGRHRLAEGVRDDAPEAVLRVAVVEGVRTREHRGKRP